MSQQWPLHEDAMVAGLYLGRRNEERDTPPCTAYLYEDKWLATVPPYAWHILVRLKRWPVSDTAKEKTAVSPFDVFRREDIARALVDNLHWSYANGATNFKELKAGERMAEDRRRARGYAWAADDNGDGDDDDDDALDGLVKQMNDEDVERTPFDRVRHVEGSWLLADDTNRFFRLAPSALADAWRAKYASMLQTIRETEAIKHERMLRQREAIERRQQEKLNEDNDDDDDDATRRPPPPPVHREPEVVPAPEPELVVAIECYHHAAWLRAMDRFCQTHSRWPLTLKVGRGRTPVDFRAEALRIPDHTLPSGVFDAKIGAPDDGMDDVKRTLVNVTTPFAVVQTDIDVHVLLAAQQPHLYFSLATPRAAPPSRRKLCAMHALVVAETPSSSSSTTQRSTDGGLLLSPDYVLKPGRTWYPPPPRIGRVLLAYPVLGKVVHSVPHGLPTFVLPTERTFAMKRVLMLGAAIGKKRKRNDDDDAARKSARVDGRPEMIMG